MNVMEITYFTPAEIEENHRFVYNVDFIVGEITVK